MKKLLSFLPVLCIAAPLALTGCGVMKLPPEEKLVTGFKVNGVYVDTTGTEGAVSRRLAFSGNPVRIEGIPEDENALVSYMLMNGNIVYTNPVSVYLDAPFPDVTPRAMVRVIVTARNGAEDGYLIEMEAVEEDVLEITVED